MEIVKLICENIPDLDIPLAGKIPSRSGLANDSEISLTDAESHRIYSRRHSYQEDPTVGRR